MAELKNNKNKSNNHKECACCREEIRADAPVCYHCGRHQNFFVRHFGDTAIIVSLLMVILAVVQLFDAFKANIDASKALKTANAAAEQTQAIADQLQNITCTVAKVNLTDLMAANFFGGTTLKTRLDLHDQIITSLKKLNIPENKIKDADEMWAKGVGVIYHDAICNALEGRTTPSEINVKASPELRKTSEELRSMLNFSQWQVPSPNDMEVFIEKKGFMNDTVKELIADYRYFLETGNIRRRDVFEKLRDEVSK